jgi:hypothetical protein
VRSSILRRCENTIVCDCPESNSQSDRMPLPNLTQFNNERVHTRRPCRYFSRNREVLTHSGEERAKSNAREQAKERAADCAGAGVAWAFQIVMSYLNTHHRGGKDCGRQTKQEQCFLPGCRHVENHFVLVVVGLFRFLIIVRLRFCEGTSCFDCWRRLRPLFDS